MLWKTVSEYPRQIEDKTHTDDLSKLMKKEGSVEEPDQMSKRKECKGVIW